MNNLNVQIERQLPVTSSTKMKIKSWNILYAYNLKTVRDIFVFCSKKPVFIDDLYRAMEKEVIAPPREKWIKTNSKRPERLRLEYIHATEYLGLIKKEGNREVADLRENTEEKEIILRENRYRTFKPGTKKSPDFKPKEKDPMLAIVLNYERARDFLYWFLDFHSFDDIFGFNQRSFVEYACPIFILAESKKGEKGSRHLRREYEKSIWTIPQNYIRLASYVFPNWFKDLGLIDEVIMFPEFGFNKKLWHMYYPIKLQKDFENSEFEKIVKKLFTDERTRRLSIPHLIYLIARNYFCSVTSIKNSLKNLYINSSEEFYFERVPLHLMKQTYKSSYIEIEGFYRSYLCYEGDI